MRQVIVLGSLLTVALVGSYLTWTAEDTGAAKDADKVAMYRADAEDLQKIAWKAEDLTIELERKKDALGEYVWVTTTEQVKKKNTPPEGVPELDAPEDGPPAEGDEEEEEAEGEDAPAEGEAAVEMETKIVSFKGNEAADKLWGSFAPLLALRKLETTAETDTSLFGFDEPKATIEIARGAGALNLVVGGETWGSRDRYVQVDGAVYLVDDADLRPLQYGKTRLVERNLQPFAEADIDKVLVTHGEQKVTIVQKNRDDRAKAFWTREGMDAEDGVAATYIDKLLRLRVQSYEKELPELEAVFTYVVMGKGENWEVQVLREKGAENPKFYAKSAFDRSVVELTKSLASEAVADVSSLFEAPTPTE